MALKTSGESEVSPKDPAVVVQSLSCARLFVTPWTAARQASLSSTISGSLLKLMSIESVMSSNHLILCRPLLLLPSIFPSTTVWVLPKGVAPLKFHLKFNAPEERWGSLGGGVKCVL